MNYRPILMNKLNEFAEQYPDYSLGQLFYSMLTHANIKGEIPKSSFLRITDQDFYTMIEKAIKKEGNE